MITIHNFVLFALRDLVAYYMLILQEMNKEYSRLVIITIS